MHPLGTLDRDLIREQGGLGLRNVIKITDNAIIP